MTKRHNKSVTRIAAILAAVTTAAVLNCALISAAEPKESGEKRGLLHSLAFSRDSKTLVAGGDSVLAYDVKSGSLIKQWKPASMTRAVAFLPGADDVVVEAGDGGAIRFRRISDDQPYRNLKLHAERVQAVVFSPDGKLAVSIGTVLVNLRPTRGELRLWNIETGERIRGIDIDVGAFFSPVFSSDGRTLAFSQIEHRLGRAEPEASVEVYQIEGWKRTQSIVTPGHILSVAFHPDGRQLMLAGTAQTQNGNIGLGKIWVANRGTGEALELATNNYGGFSHAIYTGIDDQFLIGKTQREIGRDRKAVLPQQAQIYMLVEGTDKVLWTSTSEDDRPDVQAIAVSPDRKTVAWCTYGTIFVLDSQQGRLLHGIGVAVLSGCE